MPLVAHQHCFGVSKSWRITPLEAVVEPALFLVNHSAINVRGMHLISSHLLLSHFLWGVVNWCVTAQGMSSVTRHRRRSHRGVSSPSLSSQPQLLRYLRQ